MNDLAQEIHETAVEKGWWAEPVRSLPEQLMLMVSELAEALEEFRDGHSPSAIRVIEGKPEGVPVELADCLIRILDTAEHYHIDMEQVVRQKMTYNDTRSYRHGGKKL